MTKPTIELSKLAPAKFEIIVRNPSDAMRAELVSLGYTMTVDIAGRWSVVVTSAAELDAARNPLRKYFA
jgi:hypothetical protein